MTKTDKTTPAVPEVGEVWALLRPKTERYHAKRIVAIEPGEHGRRPHVIYDGARHGSIFVDFHQRQGVGDFRRWQRGAVRVDDKERGR